MAGIITNAIIRAFSLGIDAASTVKDIVSIKSTRRDDGSLIWQDLTGDGGSGTGIAGFCLFHFSANGYPDKASTGVLEDTRCHDFRSSTSD
jgi:hypothetical protein